MGRRLESWSVVTGLSFLLLVGLLLVPLGRLFWASVVAEGGGLTLRHYAEFLGRPYYSRTIGHSFLVAGLVTLASLALAVPLAWVVARVDIPGKPPLPPLVVLPLVSPPFIGAYSWILLFGRSGYVTTALAALGIAVPTVYGMHGIVLALTLSCYSLAFFLVLGGLLAIDASLEEAAAGLGSPRWRVFRTVTLPVTLPSVLGGALLVFLTAFADFGAPMIIGEGYQVLPTIVYSLFVDEMGGSPSKASTAATVLVACTTALLLLQWWLVGRRRYPMVQTPPG